MYIMQGALGKIGRVFIKPTARPFIPTWENVEKLMIVVILHHTQSLSIVDRFANLEIPNVRSSAGTSAEQSEENRFLIDSLKFIGQISTNLLEWLCDRQEGEKLF
jgi:hypothetical protein